MGEHLGIQFDVRAFSVSKDPFDPLRHDLITNTDCRFLDSL